VIEWAPAAAGGAPPAAAAFSPLYDHFRLVGAGEVVLSRAALPGGEAWLGPVDAVRLR
jgi:hypothetical protein